MPEDTSTEGQRWDPVHFADLLNDRFLGLVRTLDRITRVSGQAMTQRLTRKQPPPQKKDEGETRHHSDELRRWARIRLCDLHLRVGQSIYDLDTNDGEDPAVRRQLCALLDEIERLEDLLRPCEDPSSNNGCGCCGRQRPPACGSPSARLGPDPEDEEPLAATEQLDDEPGNSIREEEEE